MSKALIEKIRKAREQNVTVGEHTFTVRRPTDGELVYMTDSSAFAYVRRFVVGWDLRELDIIPGGGPEPIAFDPLLFAEWISDHSELWDALAKPMLEAYKAHEEAVRGAEKN